MTAKKHKRGCTHRHRDSLAQYQLGQVPSRGQKAAGAYREGNTGGESGQGKSLAMATHPLVQRQSNGS